MLRALEIRNILIIERLDMTFKPGLNVLTGETGTGKSILLDSLGFVLGWRGRAELVREGARQGEVTAIFDLRENHIANSVLAESGIPADGELILRRVNMRDGRKIAWINDRRCSGEILRRISDTLVELHGQNHNRGLLNSRSHGRALDEFAGLEETVEKTRKAWNALQEAQKSLEKAQRELDAMRKEEAYLRHSLQELDQIDPKPGEETELDSRRRLMQKSGRICEDIEKALFSIGNDGAEGSVSHALRWLEGVAGNVDGMLDDSVTALGRALIELEEASVSAKTALEKLTFDQTDLENTEERLFAIRSLSRKHGTLPDELAEFAGELQSRISGLEQWEANFQSLNDMVAVAGSDYESMSTALSGNRKIASVKLDNAVRSELVPLKMGLTEFNTEISASKPGPGGIDAVRFVVSTNPGSPAGPLDRIASGGELSRFLLALKVCLIREGGPDTMIFDEIDSGIGGATADAVGRRLAMLAEDRQIVVVTHSPQVAARGSYHWRVAKRVENGQTISFATPVAGDERVNEIARMLSGSKITNEARAAAEKLMVE